VDQIAENGVLMRAVVCDRYGPPEVLRLEDVDRPVPKDDEVLIRVRAASVTRTDCEFRAAHSPVSRLVTGLRRPKWRIFGYELSGQVEAVGAAVTEFRAGDDVFGVNAGLSAGAFGAHAEFVCVPENAPIAHKPAGISFEEAAAISDGPTLALGCLRPAGLHEGTTILVYGASGSVGTAAVQLARHFGADVTAVCDTRNLKVVGELGASTVIDYTVDDFTKNGRTYDVIFDAVGKHSFRGCRTSLKKGGFYLATDGWQNIALARWTSRFGDKTVIFPIPPKYTRQEIEFVKGLVEAGQYRPVIDRCYPLEDVVEACGYVETGQKTGNVVLVLQNS
jgi:NADPH:quinone reductase-like Zn-dependent oxidoreductase